MALGWVLVALLEKRLVRVPWLLPGRVGFLASSDQAAGGCPCSQRALSLPLHMSWPAGGSWDVISPFHSGVSLPLTHSSSWRGWVLCAQPQEELSPLLCTYSCHVGIADICWCVCVCCRTGFAVPFKKRKGLDDCMHYGCIPTSELSGKLESLSVNFSSSHHSERQFSLLLTAHSTACC